MTHPFAIFKIKPEERWLATIAVMVFIGLNALLICSHWDMYTRPLLHGGSWSVFYSRFEMSGYDCWSWMTVSEMRIHFETLRHPLYLSFLYPMYQLNYWLMSWTGINWAVFMLAAVLIFSATYSAIFVYRILRELLSVRRGEAYMLTAMLFSFGHVMVPAMVPDHFIISMMLLTMTIYICGKKMQQGRMFKTWQSAVLLFFTSGIAASNGIKTILAGWFANGRRFFRWKYIVFGVILPLAVLIGIQRWQYYAFEVPQAREIHKIEKANEHKLTAAKKRAMAEHHKQVEKTQMKAAGTGLLSMMDFETPRGSILRENFFGETILLHEDHALEDIVRSRPVVTNYHHWWAYAIEIFFVLTLLCGAWTGRRQRLMQMLLCWFGTDILLNIVLGFAVNELYLMASGWLFIIPIASAYLLKSLPRQSRLALNILLLGLTLFLWSHNLMLIYTHLYG